MVRVLTIDISISRIYLGDFLNEVRRERAAAHTQYRKALEHLSQLLKDDPTSLDLLERIADTYHRIGKTAPTPEEATASFAESLRIREQLAKIDEMDLQPKMGLILTLAELGRARDAVKIAEDIRRRVTEKSQVKIVVSALAIAVSRSKDPGEAARCRDVLFDILDTRIRGGFDDRKWLEQISAIRGDTRFPGMFEWMETGAKK